MRASEHERTLFDTKDGKPDPLRLEGPMWTCARCHLELPPKTAPPAIDAFGIYFVCPKCDGRNRLVSTARKGRVSLQQPLTSEVTVLTPPLLRLDGDLFFHYEFEKQRYQIQVTLECLTEALGSDGTLEGDRSTLQANILQILDVARRKVRDGFDSPVKVMRSDFVCR